MPWYGFSQITHVGLPRLRCEPNAALHLASCVDALPKRMGVFCFVSAVFMCISMQFIHDVVAVVGLQRPGVEHIPSTCTCMALRDALSFCDSLSTKCGSLHMTPLRGHASFGLTRHYNCAKTSHDGSSGLLTWGLVRVLCCV